MQPTLQDNQLMSKHRVLSFKPQLRLEWRGQDGQSETEQPDHSASLGDSITSAIQRRFSVHTAPSVSLTGVRLVIADHALGLPVFRALALCTCRRQYPGVAAGRNIRSTRPAISALDRKSTRLNSSHT